MAGGSSTQQPFGAGQPYCQTVRWAPGNTAPQPVLFRCGWERGLPAREGACARTACSVPACHGNEAAHYPPPAAHRPRPRSLRNGDGRCVRRAGNEVAATLRGVKSVCSAPRRSPFNGFAGCAGNDAVDNECLWNITVGCHAAFRHAAARCSSGSV